MSDPQKPDRLISWLLVVFAAGVSLLWIARIVIELSDSHLRNDFAHYYLSSRLLIEGREPYHVPLETLYREYGFEYQEKIPSATNPPLLLWLFVPFAFLTPKVAAILWALTQIVSLAALLALTRSIVGEKLTSQQWKLFYLIVIASVPLFHHFYFSQVQLLLAAIALFAFWSCQRGKYLIAVLSITVIGMAKLFPFVLLPWFIWNIRGSWRYKVSCCAASLGMMIVIALMTGFSLWTDFAVHALPVVSANTVLQENYSVPSLIMNLGYAVYGYDPPHDVARALRHISTVVGLLCIAIGYGFCLIGRLDYRQQFCLLCIAMLIGSTTTWPHYLVFLIFPVAVALQSILKSRPVPRAVWIIALWSLVLPPAQIVRPSSMIPEILFYYLPLFSMFVLAAHFVTVGSRPNESNKPEQQSLSHNANAVKARS